VLSYIKYKLKETSALQLAAAFTKNGRTWNY